MAIPELAMAESRESTSAITHANALTTKNIILIDFSQIASPVCPTHHPRDPFRLGCREGETPRGRQRSSLCFTAASAPQHHRSLELHRKVKQGSDLATSGRWPFYEIKHLESQLGWPKPEHQGSQCFSTPLVKTCLDFQLPRAAICCQQQWPASPPRYFQLCSIFSDLLLKQSCWCSFYHEHNISSLSSSRKLYMTAGQSSEGVCCTELPYKITGAWWKGRFSISEDICSNNAFPPCTFKLCWEHYSLSCGQCRKSVLDILIEAINYCACFFMSSPQIQANRVDTWLPMAASAKCRVSSPWKKSGSTLYLICYQSQRSWGCNSATELGWRGKEGNGVTHLAVWAHCFSDPCVTCTNPAWHLHITNTPIKLSIFPPEEAHPLL